jgi:hypothetical protein
VFNRVRIEKIFKSRVSSKRPEIYFIIDYDLYESLQGKRLVFRNKVDY